MFDKRYGIPAVIIAALIGFSRMYLYVHFLTDVLLGALIGIALGMLVYFIYQKFLDKRLKKIA